MADASRLIAYAGQHGCAWRWKTTPRAGSWEALAQLDQRDGRPAPILSSGLMDDEQEALDRAIEIAIEQHRWMQRSANTSRWRE